MKLIDGDRIITAQLYDDEHEEFTEKKMSIIDYVNAYTYEGVTPDDNVLDKIRAEIRANSIYVMPQYGRTIREADVLHIIDKYKAESED